MFDSRKIVSQLSGYLIRIAASIGGDEIVNQVISLVHLKPINLVLLRFEYINYFPDKSLRGILKKRYEIKKEVRGMSTTKLKEFVWKKRWNKLRMNIAEFERNLDRFVEEF